MAVETLPWSWYSDPEILRTEQDRIFRHTWHYAGHTGELDAPGRRIAAWAGDVPVLVVRDEEGELRAFLNICRHRGSVLVDEPAAAAIIQCRYHAWTYDLDGGLRSAPRADEGLERGELGLYRAHLVTWGPFVFVNPDRDAAAPDFPALELDVEGLRHHARSPYTLEANWKIAIENYLECYHCPVAHRGFSAVVETDPDDYRLEEHDGRWSQYCVAKEGQARGAFHLLWPATKVNVFPGPTNLSIGPLKPDGPERCSGFLDYFFGADVSDEEASELMALDDQVGAEDRRLVEAVQRGVRSGAIPHGTLLPESERLVAGFQRRVADTLLKS